MTTSLPKLPDLHPGIQKLANSLVPDRRYLHAHPQTAFEETIASDLVAKRLKEWNIDFERGFAGTGLVAIIKGKGQGSGKAIGLRADMDALHIAEKTNLPWASTHEGLMHGCGHDGHTMIGLGAAKYLSETRDFDGTVYLIFQPAEETAEGAAAMIKDGLLTRFPMDMIFGIHNEPELRRGTFHVRHGAMQAGADNFSITVKGKGGHAAVPQNTINPVDIAGEILCGLKGLSDHDAIDLDKRVQIALTAIKAGTQSDNVIPETAQMRGTIRCYDPKIRQAKLLAIRDTVTALALQAGGSARFEMQPFCPVTMNESHATEYAIKAAKKIAGDSYVDVNHTPCLGSDDFGVFQQHRPGCYIVLGQGDPLMAESPNNYGLHSPYYDFNDAILGSGIAYYAALAETVLPLKNETFF